MKTYKEPSPSERQNALREQKKAALERYLKHTADPALDERLNEKAAARAVRTAGRNAATAKAEDRKARQAEAAKQAALLAEQAAEQERAAQVDKEAEAKAARDARYAARKARGRR